MRFATWNVTAVLILLLGCGAPRSGGDRADSHDQTPHDETPNDWLIVPGTRIGPVDSTTSEGALIERLGPGQIIRRETQIGEGFCAPGSVIYPGTSDSVEIIWTDTTYARPAVVRVSGDGSRWRTPGGVRVGTSLKELESLNAGRAVRFSGFGWDYGGTGIRSETGGTVEFVVHPDSASRDAASRDPRSREIYGDHEVASDHPLIRATNIPVELIRIRWGEPMIQFECKGLMQP